MTAPVIVVGAGLAGLAAARRLVGLGREVVVLEGRDRVGGRTEGGALADGTPVELGGTWIGPTQNRMYALVEELGLQTFRTWNDEGALLVSLGGKQVRVKPHKGAVPKLNPFAVADLGQGLARFERMARRVNLTEPWRTPDAARLDGQTFETWIRRNLRTTAGRAYFHIACEAVFAAEPADLSLLHALFYTHSGTDFETLLSTDQGAQQDRIVGGSIRISEAMADGLGDRVRLGSPVAAVAQDDHGVRVTLRDGSQVEGDRVVVTMPPALAGRLDYDPLLPSWRDQLTQKLPAGAVMKTFTVYPEPFWRADGLNGQVASDEGPVKITFDVSPPSGTPGVMMGFLEGGAAREMARRTASERRAAVLECFVRYFGPKAADPVEYLERDWTAEEFTRGCYGAHFAPGVWTSYGHALRTPVGRVHWAGTECSPVWNGYMEGAVRSGEAAADEVARLV
ncbi:MAG: flavin monoamine oxidase family protein [Nocardioides sp.]